MTTILDRDGIASRVPHRGYNIIPDTLHVADDGQSAVAHVRVRPDDEHGRTLFGRDDGEGGCCWYEPFLGELLALTGVPLLDGELGGTGKVSVFSMISKARFNGLAPLDSDIQGHAKITRTRGAFTQFFCHIDVDGERLVEAEVLSGTASLEEISKGETKPLPALTGEDVAPFAWKHPSMTFADAIVDAGDDHLQVRYCYPPDHPFVPTHFPGGPLMMGVTQWAAVADAAWLLAQRRGQDQLVVDANLARPDGSPIVDIRAFEIAAGPGGLPRFVSTQRVAFRDVVRPNDGVLITITAKD